MADDPLTGRIIEAGLRLLADQPAQVLDRGLNRNLVALAAGTAPATFHRKFKVKDNFLDAVVAALPPAVPYDEKELRAEAEGLAADGQHGLRAVRTLVLRRYAALTDTRWFTGHLLAHWLAPSAPTVNARVIDSYRSRDRIAHAVLEVAFEKMGVTLRRPLNARTVALVMNALIEGVQLRMRVDPANVSAELLADALEALLTGAVDFDERHRALGDALPQQAPAVPLPANPRAAVIAAAQREFGRRGYFNTSLDLIAETAGVPRDKLDLLYSSKIDIIEKALRSRIDALTVTVDDAVAFGEPVRVTIERFLTGCAQLVADETVFMDALLLAVAHDTYGESERMRSVKEKLHLPRIITEVVRTGQRSGELTDAWSAEDLAAWMTNTVLMRCFTRRTESAEVNARFAAAMALDGLSGTGA
ncbi:TetR/AcrR family transcriptional regulator [Nocardia sp. NPDC057227]|uniref:TetR/AcrR family transcriptional regulator n=1 Tax=Nocardia sp. NPDC057227 TaxID=3346056 RepID=UPI0036386AE1